jgi:hypothetical protein
MNTCKLYGEFVYYPEGVYFKNGQEVHIFCIQKKRENLRKKSLSENTTQTNGKEK